MSPRTMGILQSLLPVSEGWHFVLRWKDLLCCLVTPSWSAGRFQNRDASLKSRWGQERYYHIPLGTCISWSFAVFFTVLLGVLKERRFTYVCWPVRTYALDRAFSSSNSFLMQFYRPFPLEVFTYVYFNISNFCKLKKILYIVCNILSNCISVKACFAYRP